MILRFIDSIEFIPLVCLILLAYGIWQFYMITFRTSDYISFMKAHKETQTPINWRKKKSNSGSIIKFGIAVARHLTKK